MLGDGAKWIWKLAARCVPQAVQIVGTVPLTPVGKVDRKALRAQLKG